MKHCRSCRYALCRDCNRAIWCCFAVNDWWDNTHRIQRVEGWNHFAEADHMAAPKASYVGTKYSLGEVMLRLRMML